MEHPELDRQIEAALRLLLPPTMRHKDRRQLKELLLVIAQAHGAERAVRVLDEIVGCP